MAVTPAKESGDLHGQPAFLSLQNVSDKLKDTMFCAETS